MTPDSDFQSVLELHSLTLPKEKVYFILVTVFSVLVWIFLAVTIVGLFYVALFAVFAWLANGLLVARLRAEAVRIGPDQIPELHDTFERVCAKLGLPHPPRLYILESGGVLNAFATRFSGRNFVVIYSSMLDAIGPSSHAMQFILGHELGHIRSNHVLKKIFLAPGILLPLLGPAYLRACEASCDRHGAFVADDLYGAVRAILVLGGGRISSASLDPGAFARQHEEERGFFVSWHELVSGYPTLSARTGLLLALKDPAYDVRPSRNPLAYLAALFTPGGSVRGSTDLLVVIVVVGLLAAMAIPAFNKVREQAHYKQRVSNERVLAAAFEAYQQQTGHPPQHFSDFVGPGKILTAMPVDPDGGRYSIQIQDGQPTVICTRDGQSLDTPPIASPPAR